MANFNSFFTILNWEVDIKFSSFWFMLGKPVIQPHFDSTWPLWYPTQTVVLKKEIQVFQNNCICFWQDLGKAHKGSKSLNCLPVKDRIHSLLM